MFQLFRDLFCKRELHNRQKKISILKLLYGDTKQLKTKINLNYIFKKYGLYQTANPFSQL